MTSVSNPKGLAFYFALLPVFATPGGQPAGLQFALLAAGLLLLRAERPA